VIILNPHERLHESEGVVGLALANQRLRLRAGFVIRDKTEFLRAAGVKSSGPFLFLKRGPRERSAALEKGRVSNADTD
jgi:hypothetical protein